MKNRLLIGFAIILATLASCSGNSTDGTDKGKDTLYQYSDTTKTDSSARDTLGKDAYEDSTSNAPRMPGGN